MKADQVEVYKFLGYYMIINNLSPQTFIYENTRSTGKKYIWITHESYGKPMVEVIKKILTQSNIY